MGKVLLFMLACVLIVAAGCDLDKKIRIGVIKNLTVTEDAFVEARGKSPDNTFWYVGKNYVLIFFDDMPTMIEALRSREIDKISTYECVGDYLVDTNQEFESILNEPIFIENGVKPPNLFVGI